MYKNIIGRKLDKIEVSQDKYTVTFYFEEGKPKVFNVTGDCCSESWVEHLDLPGDIKGAEVISIRQLGEDGHYDDQFDWIEDQPVISNHPDHDEGHADSCIKVYNTIFSTNKGDIVLEYRNSSNGYYGGSLYEVHEND